MLMDAAGAERVVARYRKAQAGWTRSTPVDVMRQDFDALADPAPPDTAVTAVECGSVPAEWIVPAGARPGPVVLYLHGGGYRLGSPRSHRGLAAALAAAAGCQALVPAYRLVPEHCFPAAVDDACAACRWLCRQDGVTAVAIAGDSAGGGLALATMLALRQAGDKLPHAAVLMSPWTDLTASGPSYADRAAADPLNQRATLLAMARGYLGDADAHDPLASPIFADLSGLPPLLIQVGAREIVFSDAAVLAERAAAAGVDAMLREWAGMIHVFQQFPAELPQAAEAVREAGAFLRRHLDRPALALGETQ